MGDRVTTKAVYSIFKSRLVKAAALACFIAGGLLIAAPDALSQAKQPRKYGIMSGPTAPQKWSLVQEKSRMSYTNRSASNKDIPITNYNMQLNFDPTKLEQSRMVLTADVSSMFLPAKSVNVPLLEYLPQSTDVGQTPSTATFLSSAIKRRSTNEFIAEGGLRIGDKSKAISIPFSVTLDKNVPGGMMIILKGGFTANRADFTGENYSATGQGDVPVAFELAAIPMR
jgi:polyisoprenoid-binding protein YceI